QNRSVTANFAINTYTMVATAGPGGAIEPEGQIQVNHGDDREFIITPDAGYEIAEVVVDGVSAGAIASYTFNNVVSDHTIDASFSLLEYTITISASPTEGGTVSGRGVYKHGETVDLTAEADDSYRFKNWTECGIVVSTDPNYSFTASANRNLLANFIEKTYELTVKLSGQGSVEKQPDKARYLPEEVVNLTAIPETGWRFLNWSGALTGNTNPASITMNNDKTVIANFSINQYVIVVSPNPQNGGTVSGGGTYPHGETVTLKATPNEGYEFLNWTEGRVEVSTEEEYSFNATADRLLTANFALKSYTLETQVSGEGAVLRTPDKALYTHGETVELTAVPDNGWGFVGWSGDLESSENPAEINMDGDKSVTATFARNQYTVNLVAEPQDGGTVTGGGSYFFGDEATVTAQASDCYLFTGWYESGLLVSESAEYSFTVGGNRDIEARFTKAVISKEFVFILENFFLGCKYEVALELNPQITKVRFIYPDIDPEEQTPIPEEAFPDEEGKIEITAFWTNRDATAVVILCYVGDELVSQCPAELSK
uniref:InlB B-repeat-containing protein n=1 Tax=Mesotoga sp. TaxID=2053577 RepID=UPI00345E3C38